MAKRSSETLEEVVTGCACGVAAAAAYRPRAAKQAKGVLPAVFQHIDSNVQDYVSTLADAVAIPSVSSDAAKRPACLDMVAFYRSMMDKLGVENEVRDLGKHMCCGQEIGLPPVILGRYRRDPTKPTLCAYGHLDVQPAAKEDGWKTDPFTLTWVPNSAEEDAQNGYGEFPSGGKLHARGATDDKGPALAWLFIIEAYQKLREPFPVNLLFLVECMEESHSAGLEDVVRREFDRGGYLESAEAICIADNNWLGVRKPCVQYGLRGIVYFLLEVSGPTKDLHSGKFGGSVHEPMTDLVQLMASLVDSKGSILVPGVMDSVAPLTETERKLYEGVDFHLDSHKRAAGVQRLLHEGDLEKSLMHMWRYPSLSIHGVEGAHAGPGAKTVIPGKVIGKFSIRLVPNQEPEQITSAVRAHLEQVFSSLGSANIMKLSTDGEGAPAFGGTPEDRNYMAARRANEIVYGTPPDLVRSGGSIPVTLTMQDTGRSVVLFPVGRNDDGHHGQNEKIDLNNFVCGIKLLAAYMAEFAAGGSPPSGGLPPPPPQGIRRPAKGKGCVRFMAGFTCECGDC